MKFLRICVNRPWWYGIGLCLMLFMLMGVQQVFAFYIPTESRDGLFVGDWFGPITKEMYFGVDIQHVKYYTNFSSKLAFCSRYSYQEENYRIIPDGVVELITANNSLPSGGDIARDIYYAVDGHAYNILLEGQPENASYDIIRGGLHWPSRQDMDDDTLYIRFRPGCVAIEEGASWAHILTFEALHENAVVPHFPIMEIVITPAGEHLDHTIYRDMIRRLVDESLELAVLQSGH